MRYLGDSLPGVRYAETDTALFVLPCGDPTLLHPDFPKQPVIDLFKNNRKKIYLLDATWADKALGVGWSWDDYNDYYMPERSPLPVYGNTIRWVQEKQKDQKQQDAGFDSSPSFYSIPEVDWEVRFTTDTGRRPFFVQRQWDKNVFAITEGLEKYKTQDVPFITNGLQSAAHLLKDTIGKDVFIGQGVIPVVSMFRLLHTQPVDSLFSPMMHSSDNFFAEQTLLMVANEHLGVMNDQMMIDTLLSSDLKELPLKPSWVDGSGLSRDNLFSPRDLVWLLNKLQHDFGLERMKRLLPTGGTGTLRNYYKEESGYIFAKTGSLTGVVALSGYLITKKGRLLIFSVLINNHRGNGVAIRKDVERLLRRIREKY
jgi:D-alanyl-D-alanine carboxypeptidase/D-alanyl-D-alanine-endopeptidase (penicillin-binding protein 4)